MPNSTLSTQTPSSNFDNTTGSIIFGIFGILVLVITVVVIGILFIFRRKLFTKCLVDNSQCTADDIDQIEVMHFFSFMLYTMFRFELSVK